MTYIYADNEHVARAWAASVLGTAAVGDQLPTDNTTWAASGFVVVAPAGGASNIYYRFGHPVMAFQAWSCNLNSSSPPWWKARNLIETLRQETLVHLGRFLTIPACSENAKVLQSQFVGEPRRVFGDLGNYAAYTQDIVLHWIAAPE